MTITAASLLADEFMVVDITTVGAAAEMLIVDAQVAQ